MRKKILQKNSFGFTLIEVMISIALFVIVMTVGMGAVISANNTYKKTHGMIAV